MKAITNTDAGAPTSGRVGMTQPNPGTLELSSGRLCHSTGMPIGPSGGAGTGGRSNERRQRRRNRKRDQREKSTEHSIKCTPSMRRRGISAGGSSCGITSPLSRQRWKTIQIMSAQAFQPRRRERSVPAASRRLLPLPAAASRSAAAHASQARDYCSERAKSGV